MTRDEAVSGLRSEISHARLQAARYFAKFATELDESVINQALQYETVSWIREALKSALKRIAGDSPKLEPPNEALDLDDAYSEATLHVTGRLLHELQRLLGVLKSDLKGEFEAFPKSKSQRSVERIENFLAVMKTLHTASNVPEFQKIRVEVLIEDLLEEFGSVSSVNIRATGPEMSIWSDSRLLLIALRNGVCNAIEAVSQLKEESREVTITWGNGPGEYTFTILDNGVGLPTGIESAFEMGVSSKSQQSHFGMGLPLAKQSISSLGGTIKLESRIDGGARLHIQCPDYGES